MKPVFYLWIGFMLLVYLVFATAQSAPVSAHAQEGALQNKAILAYKSAIARSNGPTDECYYEQIDTGTYTGVNKTTIPLYKNRNLAKRGETYAFVNEAKGDVVIHVNWSGLKPHKGIMRIIVNVPVN
jgi:hypothetical protein